MVADGSYYRGVCRVCLAAFLLATGAPVLQAEVVKRWVDEQGGIHFTYQSQIYKSGNMGNGADVKTYGWTEPTGRKVYSDRSRKAVKAEGRNLQRLKQCLQGVTEIITYPASVNTSTGQVATAL